MSSTINDFTYVAYGHLKQLLADEDVLSAFWSLSLENSAWGIRNARGFVTKAGNPVVLRFVYDHDSGLRDSVENSNLGSEAQYREMRAARHFVKDTIGFKQSQRGGRKEGSVSQRAVMKYRRILNLRNSARWWRKTDGDFLDAHSDFSPSELSRAKLWNASGRPGETR